VGKKAAKSILQIYLETIGSYPLLSVEEERELYEKIQKGKEAQNLLKKLDESHLPDTDQESEKLRLKEIVRVGKDAENHLINCNLKLVVYFAKRYAKRTFNLTLLKLISDGNWGLFGAVRNFNPNKGKFATCAKRWICTTIRRAIAQDCASLSSLDKSFGGENEKNLHDILEDKKTVSPDSQVNQNLLRDKVREVLSGLKPKEELILSLRFGLEDGVPHTLKEISKILGISKERIRQIQNRGLKKLKRHKELGDGFM